jgi:hypothetical protein
VKHQRRRRGFGSGPLFQLLEIFDEHAFSEGAGLALPATPRVRIG